MAHLHKVLSKRYSFYYIKSLRLLNINYKKNICLFKKRDISDSTLHNKYTCYVPMKQNFKCYTTKYDDEFGNDPVYDNEQNENLINEYHGRINLYGNNDPIIEKLMNCNTIQEVLDICCGNPEMESKHLCQAVLVLWDLQKEYNRSYLDNLIKVDNYTSDSKLLEEYISDRNSNKQFSSFINNLSKKFDTLSLRETVYCLYYLKKMNVDLDENECEEINQRWTDKIIENHHELDYRTIVRFSAYLISVNSLKFAYTARKLLPALHRLMKECRSAEDFQKVTICFNNIHIVISKSFLEEYKEKLVNFLSSGVLNSNEYKILLQIAVFLNLRHWFIENSKYIYFICNMITPMVHKMDLEEIVTLHKVFKDHLEPALLLIELKNKVKKLLEELKCDDRIKTYSKLPDLLYCQTSISELSNRSALKNVLVQLINTGYSSSLVSIYNSLRYLQIKDPEICDMFWKRVLDFFLDNKNRNKKILLLCHMYMYFCFNIEGSYKNIDFEDSLLTYMQKNFFDNYESYSPWKFIRLFSFVITSKPKSENSIKYHSFLNELIEKYLEICHQLTARDILYLSKSIQLLQQSTNEKRYEFNRKLINILKTSIQNSYTKILSRENVSIFDLNNISKAIITLTSKFSVEHVDTIFTKYNKVLLSDLSSVNIRQTIYNFQHINMYGKKYIDLITTYCLHKKENIHGDTMFKVMSCFFNTAITPNEDFLNLFVEILYRDMYDVKSTKLLDQCLALCYFQYLPEKCIQYIFSIEFMEKLDEEIIHLAPHPQYPKMLRDKLMQLNRAVCLELPEHKIPWFHEKYLKEIAINASTKLNYHQQNVMEHLIEIVRDKSLIDVLHFTPYGYNVDFYLHKDRKGNFIPISQHCDSQEVQKIAIILEKNNLLVKLYDLEEETNSPVIKYVKNGKTLLRNRHLELMGYKVIEIYDSLWNSMHMSEPKAKYNHLYSVL